MSVIIPTRDRAASLARALRSALGQRDVALEVIVIDDGSVDDTGSILEGIGDARVRALRNDTVTGAGAARNRGIGEADGAWIAFLDDDDLWAPEKLRRQLDAARATGRRWAYAGEVVVDEGLRVVDGVPPPPPERVVADLERYDAVPGGTSSVAVAADLLDHVGTFDPDLATSEDWDLWIRLARAGPPAWVAEPLVALSPPRGRSRTMSRMLEELEIVADRHGIAPDRVRHYRWAAWEALRDRRRWQALRYYAGAVRRGDLGSILRAAVAVVGPGAAERRAVSPRGSSAWTARAEAWIRPLAGDRGDGP